MKQPKRLLQVLTLGTACAAIAGSVGCRKEHLSATTGHAYRNAVAAQRDSTADNVDELSADDAHKIMTVHSGTGPVTNNGGAGRTTTTSSYSSSSSTSSPSPSSSGSDGLWQGASGGIRLEAK